MTALVLTGEFMQFLQASREKKMDDADFSMHDVDFPFPDLETIRAEFPFPDLEAIRAEFPMYDLEECDP